MCIDYLQSFFLIRHREIYGNFAPFLVRAGFTSYLIVRDPEHINTILESDHMVPQGSHVQMFDEVMGSPKEAAQLALEQARSKKDDNLQYAHLVLPRKYLSGKHLEAFAERYSSILSRNLSDKMFQEKTWTEIEDLWIFFRNELTRAIVEAIYGSDLLKSYSHLARDFWDFDSSIEDLKRGVPEFMAPKAHSARNRILEHLEMWLKSYDHEGKVDQGNEDSGVDGQKVSDFFRARDETLARIDSITHRARAAEALALLQR